MIGLSASASALYFQIISDERWRTDMRGVFRVYPRILRWQTRLPFDAAAAGWTELRDRGVLAWDAPHGADTELDRRIVLVLELLPEGAALGQEWTSPTWGPDPEVAAPSPPALTVDDPLWRELADLREQQEAVERRYIERFPGRKGAPVFQDLDPFIGPLLSLRAREQAERARANLPAEIQPIGYDDLLLFFTLARQGETARSLARALEYLADLALQAPVDHRAQYAGKCSIDYVLRAGSRAILPIEEQSDALYTAPAEEAGWIRYADRWERWRVAATDAVYLDGRVATGTDPAYLVAFGIEQAKPAASTQIDLAAQIERGKALLST